MKNTKEKRIAYIKNKLLKFTDPRPEYTGLTAYELAKRLYEIATSEKLCSHCGDSVTNTTHCDQCQDQIVSFNQ